MRVRRTEGPIGPGSRIAGTTRILGRTDTGVVELQLDYEGEGLLARLQLPVVGLVAKRLIGRIPGQLATYAEGAGDGWRPGGVTHRR